MFGRSSNPEEQLREPRRRPQAGADNQQAVGGLPGFSKRSSGHRGHQNGSEVFHGMDSRPSALRMALQSGGDRARRSSEPGISAHDTQQQTQQQTRQQGQQQGQQQRRRGGSGEESRWRDPTTTTAAASWELREPAQPRGSSPVFRPPSVRQRQGGLNVSQSQGGGVGGSGDVSYEGQLFDSRESAGGRTSASCRAPASGYRDSVADSGVPSFSTGGTGSGRGRGVAQGRASMRAAGGIVRSHNLAGIGSRTTPTESSSSCRRGNAGNVGGHGRSSTSNQAEDAISSGATPRRRGSSSGRAVSCPSGSPYLDLGLQRAGGESGGGHNNSSHGGRIRRRGDHDDREDDDDDNAYGRRSSGDAAGSGRYRDNHPYGRGGGRGGAHARTSPSTAPSASAGPADLDRLPSIDGLDINNPSDKCRGGGGGGLRGDEENVVASSSASASMGQRWDKDHAGNGGGGSNSLAAAERRPPGKGVGSETLGQRGSNSSSRNSSSNIGSGGNNNDDDDDDGDDDRGEFSGREVALSSRRIGSGGTGGSNSNGGGSTKHNVRGSSSTSSNSSRECLVGLQNLGNTCFMNACLQCLLHTDSLVDLFRSRRLQQEQRLSSHNNKSPTNGALAEAFAELVSLVEASPAHSNVSPAQVKRLIGKYAPHLAGYGQQDCQEFLRFFLDGLAEDLNRRGGGGHNHHHHHHRGAQRASQQQEQGGPGTGGSNAPVVPDLSDEEISRLPMEQQGDRAWAMHLSRNDSEITRMFCGQLQSRISCLSCGNVSFCFDPFFDLSVPLSIVGGGRGRGGGGDEGGGGYGGRRGSGPSSSSGASSRATTTLEDCLRAFSTEETLDGDNRPVCDRCRRRRKSSKSLAIHRFPPILVIHLKRFQYNSTSRTKLSTAVEFPIGSGLDLVPYSTAAARPSSSGNSGGDADDDRRQRDSSGGGGFGHSQNGFRAVAGGGNTGSRPLPPLYELYAVCNHMGGLQGGHYTAHCRSGSSGGRVSAGEWHTFDDTRVVGPINTSRVGGASAYVLFYRLLATTPEGHS